MKKLLLLCILLASTLELSASSRLNNYRWRNNDGNETTATWKASTNTAVSISNLDKIRLRINEFEDSNFDPVTFGTNLYYSKNGGASWVLISKNGSNDFRLTESYLVTRNAPTTQQISSGGYAAGFVFVDNQPNFTLNSNTNTELEYVLEPTVNVQSNTQYLFRIVSNSYGTLPTLNTSSSFCYTDKPVVNPNVVYNLNQVASPLSATGSNLLWYNSISGGTGSSTAPTPNTSLLGSSYYYVSQTLNGCEGPRTQIRVFVDDMSTITGKSLHFDGIDDNISVSNFNLTVTNNFTLDFWVNPEKTISIPGESTSGITGASGQSYALYPTLIAEHSSLPDAQHSGAGVSIGTNGVCVFEHAGGYLPSLLSWSGTITGWTRVTVTYVNKKPSLYINGIFVKTGLTSIKQFVHPSTKDIGGANEYPHNGYGPFKGKIDRIYLLNDVYVPAPGCEPNPNNSNVIAFYDFNQGIGAGNNAMTDYLIANSGSYYGNLNNFSLTGSTSNWLDETTSVSSLPIPDPATVVSPVTYYQNQTASPLTATSAGSGLLWYSSASSTTPISTPTPSTATIGSTSYWVSSTNANGCESARTEVIVNVIPYVAATHLNFDGVNDVVNLPISVSGTASGTVEMWLQPTNLVASSIFQRQHDFVNTYTTIDIGINSNGSGGAIPGKIYFHLKNGITNLASTTILSPGQWYHIVATWNGTSASLYINGALEQTLSGAYSGLPSSGGSLTLGGYNGTYFQGNMDDIRVWNRALSQAEIQNNMNCELPTPATQNGLTAYYQFNQGVNAFDNTSVTSLTDASGNSNMGTLTNFTLTGTTSNWKSGSNITTGNTCSAFLSNNNFDISSNFKIYPNPATSNVTIDLVSLDNSNVEIYDINGRKLFTQKLNNNSNNVNIDNLAAGVYMFKVTSVQGSATSKVIKQ
jgi:hypothetical protein